MFPYEDYKDTELWKKIDEILRELEENQDIKLTTAREYVVGYLCKRLTEADPQ
jgi:hypothetical protein